MHEGPAILNLSEWQELSPDDDERLAALSLTSEHSRTIARSLSKSGKLHIEELRTGLRIQTTSYVGRISLDDVKISVVPKLPQFPLSVLFAYAYGIRKLHMVGRTGQPIDQKSFVDLIIQMILAETRELLSRGLKRTYRRRSEELASPRGRLDLRVIACQPVSTATVPCIHNPRSFECLANRVLLAGLQASTKLAQDPTIRGESRMLWNQIFDLVGGEPAGIYEVERFLWECDRLTVAYRPISVLTLILLSGQGVSLEEHATTEQLPGFLFDMNSFFQELVSKLLHDGLPECNVLDEFRLRNMLRYSPQQNPRNRKDPNPRPDFVLAWPHGNNTVLDAKYRDLWNTTLPRDMLYQLCMYALSSVGGGESGIIYPTTDYTASEQRVEIANPITGEFSGGVTLRPLNLDALATRIEQGCSLSANLDLQNVALQITGNARENNTPAKQIQ